MSGEGAGVRETRGRVKIIGVIAAEITGKKKRERQREKEKRDGVREARGKKFSRAKYDWGDERVELTVNKLTVSGGRGAGERKRKIAAAHGFLTFPLDWNTPLTRTTVSTLPIANLLIIRSRSYRAVHLLADSL